MGNIVGSITDAIGLTNNSAADAANKNANAQQARANALTDEQIAFNKEQYADWKDVYGDLQTNLGDYYKNLGEDRVASLGLTQYQREYQDSKTKVAQDLAQRGLTDSPVAAATMASGEFQNAVNRSNIRTQAKDSVKQQQLGFLALGLNQGANILSGVNSAYGTGVQSSTGLSTNSANNSAAITNQNTQNTADFIGTIAGFAAGGK